MAKKSDEGLPPRYRITRASDYRAVYRSGRAVHSGRFVLFGQRNNLDHHRLGLTVSRKVGRAVVRNRVKRLFREIFRKSSDDIPSHFDIVINARPGCKEASYLVLQQEFLSAAHRLCR